MNYRTLGKTGIQVSSICFGAMSFGSIADEDMSKAMFHRCREAGINFFDTADVYAGGRSEQILGRLVADCRDEIVLTSKFCLPVGQGVNSKGMSRRHMMLSVEGSLKRLNTDRIDVYFVHHFDSETAMEETLRGLDDLQQQGKILYPAVSNWAAWQIAKALGISDKEGLARFECIQPMYNLVKRQSEVEILPLAESEKLGVITYSPLAAGLLTGKYNGNAKLEQGRFVEHQGTRQRYAEQIYAETAERFHRHAIERGVHPASLAIAWIMANPAVTAPIIGARNLEQLEPLLSALDIEMTQEWRREISALSITPPPATDRSEEVS
ncbi:aldo/keto reductase [Paenibacillus piri]|uniref:Aldo/keto reductase n=1 Tax=Paenibacillus piri TaxID=2547395 RepID=A0A4R5KFK4_9BACL|nr:aldo/keto reductase [Paenibacillus piri]TDF94161.1 aldo/keto reductase [Paenibacillus piri]